jgi:hypothetical protein
MPSPLHHVILTDFLVPADFTLPIGTQTYYIKHLFVKDKYLLLSLILIRKYVRRKAISVRRKANPYFHVSWCHATKGVA